jgi:hypothetical protein
MGAGVFGFVVGAAAAFLFMKVYRRAGFKLIKSRDVQLEPDQKLQGAMRAIDEISAVMGKLSVKPTEDTEANGKLASSIKKMRDDVMSKCDQWGGN